MAPSATNGRGNGRVGLGKRRLAEENAPVDPVVIEAHSAEVTSGALAPAIDQGTASETRSALINNSVTRFFALIT